MTETQPKSNDSRIAVELALWKALQIAREERDEARREVCESDTETHGGALLEANRRGWDCFKEKA